MSACKDCAAYADTFAVGETCQWCGHAPIPFEVPEGVGVSAPARLSLVPLPIPQPASRMGAIEGVTMSEPMLSAPAVSPTGTAQFNNQMILKAAGALVGVAGVLAGVFPPHTIAFKVCVAVTGLGGFLGIASPGFRK